MKTLYMETTKKEPEETASDIQALLKGYKLVKFMLDYEDGVISGCVFSIKIDGKEIPIKLPIRWKPLFEMSKRGETKYIKDEQQAQRVAWRQMLKWLESQFAIIDIEMVDIKEVFLPYMMIDKSKTFYQYCTENNFKLIGDK